MTKIIFNSLGETTRTADNKNVAHVENTTFCCHHLMPTKPPATFHQGSIDRIQHLSRHPAVSCLCPAFAFALPCPLHVRVVSEKNFSCLLLLLLLLPSARPLTSPSFACASTNTQLLSAKMEMLT
jgi:hypothetical protein